MPERAGIGCAVVRRRSRLAVVILGIALGAGGGSGCGATPAARAPEPGAREAARAYGRALAAGDLAGARALEAGGDDPRAEESGGDAGAAGDAHEELAEVGRALVEAPPSATREVARVPLVNGETVVLARDPDGGWRIEGGVLGVPALVSPRDAVAALRSALARRDLRAIEELLARRTRAAWEEELRRVIDQTADADALAIEVEGERAVVTTPDGARIELALEAEEWRVVDVRPSAGSGGVIPSAPQAAPPAE